MICIFSNDMATRIMKILYDHQIFSLQKYGGISRSFCELMMRFSKDPAVDFSLALRVSFNEHLLALPELDSHWSRMSILNSYPRICSAVNKPMQYERLRTVLTNVLEYVNQRESERLLKKQDFDLLHPTYYDSYFLRSREKKPCVITVHDMIHEIFPDNFPPHDPIRSWKKEVVENAEGIITISQSTKSDIVRFFRIDPDRIHVIYHGNPFEERMNTAEYSAPLSHPVHEKPYILFVGTRSGYKNFDFFIRGLSPLLHKNDQMQVCCAGGGPFTIRERELFKDLEVPNQVHYVQPDDQLMKKLYTNALAFVFPSLYEGFGLPVLEAFSCNCPVILSNASSLPEIGGDAAIYFDPSDQASLTSALEQFLSDDSLRMKLILKGHERQKMFSWEKTARETKTVYEKVITG